MTRPNIIINQDIPIKKAPRTYQPRGLSRWIVMYSKGMIKTQFGANLFMLCVALIASLAIYAINSNEKQSGKDLQKYIFNPATTIPEKF
jgi:hypothetical protein